MVRVCLYSPLRHQESKELSSRGPKYTVGGIQLQLGLLESIECLGEMINVIFPLLAFHQHVVNVNFHGSPNLVMEHGVNKPLISGPRIIQPKRHDLVVIKALVNDEQRLLMI